MKKRRLILVINPGSTSTKIALFDNETQIFAELVAHSSDELNKFDSIYDQYQFRYKEVMDKLSANNIKTSELSAVIGRGGLLKPLESGTYRVNELMLEHLKLGIYGNHASNLGAIIAHEIALISGIPSFITDPVVVDEMTDIAKITGLPEVRRKSTFHALNHKACAKKAASDLGKSYDQLNLIIAHMGGGISVAAHKDGRVIDVNDALFGQGPFSPERAGILPTGALMEMCFNDGSSISAIKKRLVGQGGLLAHLGTSDAREIENRIREGDKQFELVYKAMAYQIAKEIGSLSTVLTGKVDAVILTGGLAKSSMLTDWIIEMVGFISRIIIYPGENEMLAMAEAVVKVLDGEEKIKEYV